jgi:hypothetical protein
MTARDFRDEQSYFLTHHRLHQRVLHGSGIVCGLDVVPHPDPDCQSRGWVVITPGIAVDCFGRDVIVREPLVVNVARLFPHTVPCGAEAGYVLKESPKPADKKAAERARPADPDDGPEPADPPPAGTGFLIGVRYGELCVEPVPVLIDETGCGERKTPNRVREAVCVRYRRCGSNGCGPDDCWGPPPSPGGCPATSPDEPPIPKNLAEVLAPLCPCKDGDQPDDGFVPLAKCRFNVDGPVVAVADLDRTGRRYLPGPLNPRHLTHICKTNWNHGGEMWLLPDGRLVPRNPASSVKQGMEQVGEQLAPHGHPGTIQEGAGEVGQQVSKQPPPEGSLRLTITFDRALSEGDLPQGDGPDDPIWFYRRIFQVRYVTGNGDLEPLPGEAKMYLSGDRTRLVYESPLHCVQGFRKEAPEPVIHVILNCNFLPDQYGRAVDGNHLKGLLAWKDDEGNPRGMTGDGVEGGVFESWFKLHW